MKGARFLTGHEAALLSRATEHWLRLRDVELNLGEQALKLLSHSTVRSSRCKRTDIASLGWTADVLFRGAGTPVPLTLVGPEDDNLPRGRLSVLSAIGLALIGLAVGAIVQVPLATGQAVRAKLLATRPSTTLVQPSHLEEVNHVC